MTMKPTHYNKTSGVKHLYIRAEYKVDRYVISLTIADLLTYKTEKEVTKTLVETEIRLNFQSTGYNKYSYALFDAYPYLSKDYKRAEKVAKKMYPQMFVIFNPTN